MKEHNSEGQLLKEIMLAVSKAGARVFRQNVGIGWVGRLTEKRQTSEGLVVTLNNARPLHAGLVVGSSDLIGWTPTVVTPEMVGRTVALFTAVEVKAGKNKLTKEQRQFLEHVRSAGGIAVEARSVADVLDILNPESQDI